nr:ribosome maturation factor RimM [Gammaproteobacteria bacterium]
MTAPPQPRGDGPAPRIVVGRVGSAHGIQGWLRIQSYTQPQENILDYSPWRLRIATDWRSVEVVEGRRQGKGLVVKLAGCADREAAHQLLGAEIFVDRQQLPEPNAMEYYWADLIGVVVVNCSGVELGRVVGLLATGANDVLRTQGDRERLIPFLLNDVVREVDLRNRTIRVDWEPDF